jgi:signal transduction histidine kinase
VNPGPAVIVAARDAAVRKARIDALAGEALRAREAASDREILTLAESEMPDLLLLDIDLAFEDGIDVCRRLLLNPAFTAPILLCISASAPQYRKRAAFKQAADAHLVEPAEPGVLPAMVRSMLRLAGMRREYAASTEKIRRLEAQLTQAQADAEQFAAQACHDVEEPLRGVTTFAQLIEERREARLSDTERAYLEHVRAASGRVRLLVRSMLAYSRAGRRRAHFGPVDLRTAASAAIKSINGRAEETGSAIRLAPSLPCVLGDFGELQEVFGQVIRNAIDYRKPGCAASVIVRAEEAEPGEWVIGITDNGPGIPQDRLATIFLPFKRLHGREIPGSGMGLAIANRIVEAHGGRMWVESENGQGSTFYFTLPGLQSGSETL